MMVKLMRFVSWFGTPRYQSAARLVSALLVWIKIISALRPGFWLGLYQLEAEVLRQAADVVVGLDLGGRLFFDGSGRFDDIGVERALGQESDLAELSRLLLEDADELVADNVPLLLGVDDAFELAQEPFAGVDDDDAHTELLEGLLQ